MHDEENDGRAFDIASLWKQLRVNNPNVNHIRGTFPFTGYSDENSVGGNSSGEIFKATPVELISPLSRMKFTRSKIKRRK